MVSLLGVTPMSILFFCIHTVHLVTMLISRKIEHFCKFHSPMQTLRRWADGRHAMDNLRQLIALLLDQPDILAVFVSEYWSNVGNHHDKCHKNVLIQNKNKQLPSSKTDICTQGNPCRALDTSINE